MSAKAETPKQKLRQQFRRARTEFVRGKGEFEKQQLDDQLCQQLTQILAEERGVWLSYRARGDEADPSLAVRAAKHIRWAYPAVEGNDLCLRIPHSDESFQVGSYGIEEPRKETSSSVNIQECAGALVPGTAFDLAGHRLGSGKGFYDRLLQNFRGRKIGVAYSVQISTQLLPSEPFDIAMTDIVSEKGHLGKGELKWIS